MKAGEILTLLEPFSTIYDPKALTPEHRVLQFNPDSIRGRSSHAAIDVKIGLGLPPFALEVGTLLDTFKTLPVDDEVELKMEGAIFMWRCGSAKGRHATKPPVEFAELPPPPANMAPCTPALSRALELGALSCHNSAMASIGMHGMVVFEDGDMLRMASSDNTTVAIASIPLPAPGVCPRPITIGARALLFGIRSAPKSGLLPNVCARKGHISFGPDVIHYADDTLHAMVNLTTPLAMDIWALAKPFLTSQTVVRLNKDKLETFTRRTSLLTESKARWTITIAIENDRVSLRFAENLSAAQDDYPLADVTNVPPCEVTVDGYRLGNAVGLSNALDSADDLVLDHASTRKMLIFRSRDGSFQYLVSGRAL